jgi:mono/diheme cytochrome c family protein
MRTHRCGSGTVVVAVVLGMASLGPAAEPAAMVDFQRTILPLLETHCLGCHSAELKKGGISFEFAKDAHDPVHRETWLKSLKMVRAGLMPPKKKERLTAEEVGQLETWIKYSAFGINPKNPNPGHVTLRRLNRTEYRNTIRDLMGVDFNTTAEFPADDTGHGFDNIGDVLTISPLLMEKYIAAAKMIVGQAVPMSDQVPAERRIAGQRFSVASGKTPGMPDGPLALPYTKAATAKYDAKIEKTGAYKLLFDISAHETYVDGQNDYNKCRVTLKAGNTVLHKQEFVRQGGRVYKLEFDQAWDAGTYPISLELEPLTPKERQVRNLTLRLNAVTIRGPMAKEHWVRPANYERYFPDTVPVNDAERQEYTKTLLRQFAGRAFRRPVDDATVHRLASIAESTAAQPGKTFEAGIAQAMIGFSSAKKRSLRIPTNHIHCWTNTHSRRGYRTFCGPQCRIRT